MLAPCMGIVVGNDPYVVPLFLLAEITTLSKTDMNCTSHARNSLPCHLRARHLRCPVEPRRGASRRDLQTTEMVKPSLSKTDKKNMLYVPNSHNFRQSYFPTARPHPSPAAPPSPSKGKAFQRLCEHSGSIVTSVQLFVFRSASIENKTKEVLPIAFPFEGEGGAAGDG